MKIAISTSGCDLTSPLDPRFGRAPKFIIYNSDFDTCHVVNNTQNLEAAQGAGIQSALLLKKEQVDCVVTGNCGPKAYATLDAAGIAVYTSKADTVLEAVEQLRRGELAKEEAANVKAHWV